MSQQGFSMPELLIPDEALSAGDDGAEGASASVPWSFYAQNTSGVVSRSSCSGTSWRTTTPLTRSGARRSY